jgi:hypothetical protein
VWGNGACSSEGGSNARFLQMVASHGYLAIASGPPAGGMRSTTAQMMTASIDFATKVAGTGKYANVDAGKIMAAGFSCGGVEAMAQAWDPRVKSIGVYSSGLLTNYTAASTFSKPVFYVLGGSSDIAYANVSLCPRRCVPVGVSSSSLPSPSLTVDKPRVSAISRLSRLARRRGRATCPLATAATCTRPTAESSEGQAWPGWSTSSGATRRPRITFWATATRLMDGKFRPVPWIS